MLKQGLALFLIAHQRYLHKHYPERPSGRSFGWFMIKLRSGQKEFLIANNVPFVITPTTWCYVAISNECLHAAIETARTIQQYTTGPLETYLV